MFILYLPQLNNEDKLEYEFIGDKIIATYNDKVDEFDFTDMSDGFANSFGKNPTIISNLPINPLVEVQKKDGILKVKLIKFISDEATDEEKFPDWTEVL